MVEFNPKIKGELAEKIEQLSKVDHLDPLLVIENAVNFYHKTKLANQQNFAKTPFAILQDSGLIGAFDGEENLSVNYKKHLWNE